MWKKADPSQVDLISRHCDRVGHWGDAAGLIGSSARAPVREKGTEKTKHTLMLELVTGDDHLLCGLSAEDTLRKEVTSLMCKFQNKITRKHERLSNKHV